MTGSIGPSFTVTQSQPVSLNVSVVDESNIIPLAAVTANFGDGDPSITLGSQGNGVWSGTWTPESAQGQIERGHRGHGRPRNRGQYPDWPPLSAPFRRLQVRRLRVRRRC